MLVATVHVIGGLTPHYEDVEFHIGAIPFFLTTGLEQGDVTQESQRDDSITLYDLLKALEEKSLTADLHSDGTIRLGDTGRDNDMYWELDNINIPLDLVGRY